MNVFFESSDSCVSFRTITEVRKRVRDEVGVAFKTGHIGRYKDLKGNNRIKRGKLGWGIEGQVRG